MPAYGQFTTSPCISGSFDYVGIDTEIKSCTLPIAGQIIKKRCVTGSYNSLGQDALIEGCSSPLKGKFVSQACVERGENDTVTQDCDEPKVNQYVYSPCFQGAYNFIGLSSRIVDCKRPEEGKTYVLKECVKGQTDAPGKDTELELCNYPMDGQYMSEVCSSGLQPDGQLRVGFPGIVSECTSVSKGSKLVEKCKQGDTRTKGKQAIYTDCSEGNYCIDGVERPCPRGEWNDQRGLWSCNPCKPGTGLTYICISSYTNI
jgi:hypothetical protein